jgi:hypothetical protein
MLVELGITSAEFSANPPDAYGRPQAASLRPKRETLILVSGYNVQMRARIIDRWQELEVQQAAQGARVAINAGGARLPVRYAPTDPSCGKLPQAYHGKLSD